jgi:hypothetical protein
LFIAFVLFIMAMVVAGPSSLHGVKPYSPMVTFLGWLQEPGGEIDLALGTGMLRLGFDSVACIHWSP